MLARFQTSGSQSESLNDDAYLLITVIHSNEIALNQPYVLYMLIIPMATAIKDHT